MKAVRVLLWLFLFVMCLSTLAQSDDNKKTVQDLFLKVWNEKDYRVLNNIKGDTISFHWNNYHFMTNKMELQQLVEMWHRSFENFKFEILHIISQGDLVAINLRYTGKHVHDFMGTPATGNDIDISEMMFFRFENGVLKEAWELYDQVGMNTQMTKIE